MGTSEKSLSFVLDLVSFLQPLKAGYCLESIITWLAETFTPVQILARFLAIKVHVNKTTKRVFHYRCLTFPYSDDFVVGRDDVLSFFQENLNLDNKML